MVLGSAEANAHVVYIGKHGFFGAFTVGEGGEVTRSTMPREGLFSQTIQNIRWSSYKNRLDYLLRKREIR